MSLWTPSGEHPVDRQPSGERTASSASGPPGAAGGPSLDDLTPEQRAQYEEMARQMEAAQAQMLQMPAGMVVGQQTMQYYELAALYLSQQPPRLEDARIAIDALGAVVDKLGVRLGDAEQPLRQAVHQLRLAFVQVAGQAPPAGQAGAPGGGAGATGGTDGGGAGAATTAAAGETPGAGDGDGGAPAAEAGGASAGAADGAAPTGQPADEAKAAGDPAATDSAAGGPAATEPGAG